MIEISLGKLVLLALIALIVLGPEKLPGAARTAGALLRRLRGGWDNVRAEVERELEIEEIKRVARATAAQAEAAQAELKGNLQQVREPFAEAAALVHAGTSAHPTTTEVPMAATEEGVAVVGAEPGVVAPGDDLADGVQAELPLGEPPLAAHGSSPHDHA